MVWLYGKFQEVSILISVVFIERMPYLANVLQGGLSATPGLLRSLLRSICAAAALYRLYLAALEVTVLV
jgi:hypothetical protein